jgi:selT/selW/selH-like putative selenoprotein
LAEAVKAEFGIEAKVIAGGGGVFDVHLDDSLVWSKFETGRFPEHREVLDRIAQVVGRA